MPWDLLSDQEVIGVIMKAKALVQPRTCADAVYDVMRQCWRLNPTLRMAADQAALELRSISTTELMKVAVTEGLD